MQQLRLIGMTSLLTILIWVAADSSLSDSASLQVNITPSSGGGSDMRVEATGAYIESFDVQVSGRKATITLLKSREPLTVRVPVSSRGSGLYTLQLIDEVRNHAAELSEVFVQAVTPPTLDIQVDRDKVVTMPVQVLRGSLDYEGPLVVDPTEVEVTISELDYERLDRADRRVVLDPDEYLRTAPRGQLLSTGVPLTPIVGGFNVQLFPESVTVQFKLAEQLQEETLSAVPIKIESSLDIFNEYKVEVRDAGTILTQPITIKGPIEEIERIRAGEIRIWGVISLTAADKADTGQYRYLTPRFNLPEGVELVTEIEPIEFRLVPGSATAPDTS